MELARKLEENGIELQSKIVGGAVATLKMPPLEKVFMSDLEKLASLQSMGATVPILDEDQMLFSKHVRWDIAIGVASFNSMIKNLRARNISKIAAPLYCIYGTLDPTTPDFRYKFKDWEFYAHKINLIVINNVGHYFSRDCPEKLAYILHQIITGNDDAVCEKPESKLRFKIKSLLQNI